MSLEARAEKPSFHGKYAALRKNLDYSYHAHYSTERQYMQDSIIDFFLNSTRLAMDETTGGVCSSPPQPWILFTAGAMGAGKSWSIHQLAKQGHFPLERFVSVDPDDIRRHLPEFKYFLQSHPENAGEWTRKEAGFVAELLIQASLRQGRNVLVDGSLRDARWYQTYFDSLRQAYSSSRIAILHVTAPSELVMQRARDRSLQTGRVVPEDTLEDALVKVPRSIEVLRPQCDYFAEIQNAESLELIAGGSWKDFAQTWSQTCSEDTI
jgi:predicted kinase